ncbi:short-subunit dehydrogenase [Salibacterium salarium]|uniref:SDR family NAD(P)-dependent oxidoreductase n=1 Tax=Salibacterium salarium TaxID=284579 RepID=UPI0027894398|nr:SDR family oxidoreductase [Salibacterium salarium]MDQ0299018.1 short-subunit dehydrogenase [Salibacterium salarium]
MARTPKNILITGASSGIGAELAKKAADNGDYPLLVARSVQKLKSLEKELRRMGCVCSIFPVDVTDEQAVIEMIVEIEQHFGEIDVVINNAGVGTFDLVENLTSEDVKQMINVNITGVFNITKTILPYMKTRNDGHIINIGSQAGRLATPKSSIYAATKHALIGFSNALRLETSAFSIRVSIVNPGPVRTPFIRKADPSGNYEKAVENFFVDPAKLAKKIMGLVDKPRRELNLPWWMAAAARIHAVIPAVVEKLGNRQFKKK